MLNLVSYCLSKTIRILHFKRQRRCLLQKEKGSAEKDSVAGRLLRLVRIVLSKLPTPFLKLKNEPLVFFHAPLCVRNAQKQYLRFVNSRKYDNSHII